MRKLRWWIVMLAMWTEWTDQVVVQQSTRTRVVHESTLTMLRTDCRARRMGQRAEKRVDGRVLSDPRRD